MIYELVIDKELEQLCPALSAEELKQLEANIEDHGCLDEIVLWANHDKTIIDGHNRYRICKKLGKTYKTKSLAFKTKDEVKEWMLRNQIGRRNLTDSQRAMMAARLATLCQGRQEIKPEATSGLTQKQAAEAAGVSDRTIREAKQVIANGTPELQKQVTNGEVSVTSAAAVATLPKAEQKKVAAKGPDAVKAKAKEVKAAKKTPKPETKESGNEFLDNATKGVPSDVKDGHGDEVTGELRNVFEICHEFKEKRQALTNIKTWITQRLSHPGCAVLASGESRIKADIDNLDIELKFATPYCACVYCKNKMPKVANCTACKGRGWITQEIYKQAPKEMKRA